MQLPVETQAHACTSGINESQALNALAAAADRLFLKPSDRCDVGVVRVTICRPQAAAGPHSQMLYQATPRCAKTSVEVATGLSKLQSLLQNESASHYAASIIIIDRTNSWSRMNITWPMFKAICGVIEPPEAFLRIVDGMGRRLTDTDEDAMFSHFQLYLPTAARAPGKALVGFHKYEICYNIRYFARHGRDCSDPWSLRQTAVCQNYRPNTSRHEWIFIQPPPATRSLLQDAESSGRAFLPLKYHLEFIQVTLSEWRDYLNYIDDGLRDLHEAVVVPRPLEEFPVSFALVQKITLSRWKLHRAEMILQKTICLLRQLASEAEAMAATDCADCPELTAMQGSDPSRQIQNMLTEQQGHLHTTHRLLNMAGDLLLLYGKIMTNQGRKVSHTNSFKMASIAQDGAAESKTMLALAEQSGRESRTVRILTLAAMVYLPANLVMSFFSTQLVGQADEGGIYVRHEVWWAVTCTIVLSLATFGMTTWGLWGINGQRRKMVPVVINDEGS